MKKDDINSWLNTADLIIAYLNQTLNEDELIKLSEWLETPENHSLFEKICNEHNLNATYQTFQKYDANKALTQTKQVMNLTKPKGIKLKDFWKPLAIAASVLLIFNLGLWFYSHIYTNPVKYENIVAGSNMATITLPGGKKINLSNSKTGVVINANALSYNDGSLVSGQEHLSTHDPDEYLTAETPKGGTYQVILPDGSKVWLNAASRLRFTSTFLAAVSREVELIGEAYFEVVKDAKHPFIVKTARQEVTVLGTHFNINSYTDETVDRTTLMEGSVRVRALNPEAMSNAAVVLKPGQQLRLDNVSLMNVAQVDVETEVAWKNGDFVFKDEPVQSIMRKLSRWYNVDVSYEGEVSPGGFNGKVSRSKNINQVLKALESTKSIHFKVEGRRITVMD